jgi:hypothetical protein
MIAGRDRIEYDPEQSVNGARDSGAWVVELWHGRKVAVSAWDVDDIEARRLAEHIAEWEDHPTYSQGPAGWNRPAPICPICRNVVNPDSYTIDSEHGATCNPCPPPPRS